MSTFLNSVNSGIVELSHRVAGCAVCGDILEFSEYCDNEDVCVSVDQYEDIVITSNEYASIVWFKFDGVQFGATEGVLLNEDGQPMSEIDALREMANQEQ